MAETLRAPASARCARRLRSTWSGPYAADGRLGGHIVQGHVDGVGHDPSRRSRPRTGNWSGSPLPATLARYVAEKGSIAVDGVSLTVAEVRTSRPAFTVALIPTTLDLTTLGAKRRR